MKLENLAEGTASTSKPAQRNHSQPIDVLQKSRPFFVSATKCDCYFQLDNLVEASSIFA